MESDREDSILETKTPNRRFPWFSFGIGIILLPFFAFTYIPTLKDYKRDSNNKVEQKIRYTPNNKIYEGIDIESVSDTQVASLNFPAEYTFKLG